MRIPNGSGFCLLFVGFALFVEAANLFREFVSKKLICKKMNEMKSGFVETAIPRLERL
jgi:hypothetical protein